MTSSPHHHRHHHLVTLLISLYYCNVSAPRVARESLPDQPTLPPRGTKTMEQMHALHTMSPRSRILELIHLGEEAKRMETNGAVLETRIRKWKAVGKFVTGYCDLAWLGFLSEEHDVWCGEICYQAALREAVLPVSYSQRRHFEKQYCTLVSDKENLEDWLDSMVSRVREHLEMLDEEHLEMLEMPEDDLICPGFCAVGHEDGAPDGICHD